MTNQESIIGQIRKLRFKEEFKIPTPEDGESESDFISRCMSELNDEFPDQSQRAAVCYNSWREGK